MTDQQPDYLNLDIPEDKDPREYNHAERRREIVEYIKKYQDPALVPKSKLADRYDVSNGQISHDFNQITDYLEEYNDEHIGQRVKIFLNNIFDELVEKKKTRMVDGKKVDKNLSPRELKELYDFTREHADWLVKLGSIDSEPEHIALTHDIADDMDKLISFHKDDGD